MKSKIVSAALVVGLISFIGASSLRADNTTSPVAKKGADNERRFERIDAALDKLNLSPDQRDKINAILTDAASKLRDLRQSVKGTKDRTAIRDKVKQLMLDTRAQILAVLTPEQKAQLKAERKELRQESPRTRGLHGASTRPTT